MGYVQERGREDIYQEEACRVIPISKRAVALNGICPYFTMFPLDFPLGILRRRAQPEDRVLDPFCGRGTTNFAARLLGLDSLGVDSSSIAVAITGAKLVSTTADEILCEARRILSSTAEAQVPKGEFWNWAYHPEVLQALCRYRKSLSVDCSAPAQIALRGIILGALHGPKQKTAMTYLSNQCPRTYAPKPNYATRYWKSRELVPEYRDILDVIERRARRYYEEQPSGGGAVRLADSRSSNSVIPPGSGALYDWVITSPPYYGMRTYVPDQWLRNWFLGGTATVDYGNKGQVVHSSPEGFAFDLRTVWNNVAAATRPTAKLVVRFGGIPDRRIEPLDLLKESFSGSNWRVTTVRQAGSARTGKRQADTFLRSRTQPIAEYDVWLKKK